MCGPVPFRGFRAGNPTGVYRNDIDTERPRADQPRRRGNEGGGGLQSRGFPDGRFRLRRVGPPAVAALLAGLAALPAAAQTCTPATPRTGTMPTVTYDGAYTATISCETLTGGLELTVGPKAKVGTQAAPITKHGIQVEALGDGNKHISVVNSGVVHMREYGIFVDRDDTGRVKVEHRAGRIVAGGGGTTNATMGIRVEHDGEANTVTGGVHVVSAADIDLTAANPANHMIGIAVYTPTSVAAGTTVPIRVDMTGGTITAGTPTGAKTAHGIHVNQRAKGGIAITVAGGASLGTESAPFKGNGILAQIQDSGTGPLSVVNNGVIRAKGDVISTANFNTAVTGALTVTNGGTLVSENASGVGLEQGGAGEITVTAMAGSAMKAGTWGILANIIKAENTRTVTVTNGGQIDAGTQGIHAAHSGTGAVAVTVAEGGTVKAGEAGISANSKNSASKGTVTVTNNGKIDAGTSGIYAFHQGTGVVTVTNGGKIDAGTHGIHAAHNGTGAVAVTVAEGGTVTAVQNGVFVERGEGVTGTQTVTVRGKVAGGDGEWSGIQMDGGGTVVIGPRARVEATSGVLARADAAGAMTVTLEKGPHGLAGHFLGKVPNTGTTSFTTRTGEDGTAETLSVGDTVDMRGETKGVFDAVRRAELEKVDGGHAFTEVPGTETRVYHDRARVHEALPSVLLDLVRQASPAGGAVSMRGGGGAATRSAGSMAAARGGSGAWARIDAGGGKRRAAVSTTGKGYRGLALSWDTEHWGVEAGLDLPVDDRLTLGVGLRHLRGEAKVDSGGKIDVSGLGLGLSATHTGANGLYIDGWLSHTRFRDIDLSSNTGSALVSGLSGTGTAAGFRAGRRMEVGGVALTPRGGLAWSSVGADAFDDVAAAGGGKVTVGRARSLVGSVGAAAEFGGSAGSSGRGFASLDLEHEFSPDRRVAAPGAALSSKAKATWVRLGLGGALDLDAAGTVRLSGQGHYATAGGGNSGYGGSVSLTLRF